MSKEKETKIENVKPLVVKPPVVPKECDHKGKLEVVSAEFAALPSIVEKLHNIYQCKACGEIVITDKKD